MTAVFPGNLVQPLGIGDSLVGKAVGKKNDAVGKFLAGKALDLPVALYHAAAEVRRTPWVDFVDEPQEFPFVPYSSSIPEDLDNVAVNDDREDVLVCELAARSG